MKRKQSKKPHEITCTEYKIMYRKKADPEVWLTKCIVPLREQAEKFINILENVSDIYAELKVEPVTVHKIV